jgi:hypothetical protein
VERFRGKAMVAYVCYLDGPKGADADVEDDLGVVDPAGEEAGVETLREVKARRGGGDAAFLAGKDGLVSRAVVLAVGSADVGWKRDVARSLQGFVHRSAEGDETHAAAAVFVGRGVLHHDLQVGAGRDHGSRTKPLAGTQEGFPILPAEAPEEKDLGRPASRPLAEKARGEDSASVHHHEVARSEQVGQVAEEVVPAGSRPPIEDEQARGVALGQGLLRDGRRG